MVGDGSNPNDRVGGYDRPGQLRPADAPVQATASCVWDPSRTEVLPALVVVVIGICAAALALPGAVFVLTGRMVVGGLMFGAGAALWLAAVSLLEQYLRRHRITTAQLPQRYRGHLVAALAKVALIHETVRRLPESAVSERLAPQMTELDQVLWNLAVAAQSTEGLIRAEAAATAGQARELQATLAHRLEALDLKFSEQLASLEDTYRATKRIEASVVLWEPQTLELLADVDQPMADAEGALAAVFLTVSSMHQAVEEINRTLEVGAPVGGGPT